MRTPSRAARVSGGKTPAVRVSDGGVAGSAGDFAGGEDFGAAAAGGGIEVTAGRVAADKAMVVATKIKRWRSMDWRLFDRK